MDYRKIIIVVGSIVIFGLLVVFTLKQKSVTPIISEKSPQIATSTKSLVSAQPTKTDYGTATPADFPIDIPLEKGAKVEQSYSLNYTGQKQLTIVFSSTKAVKENYFFYTDFLEKQDWNISNKYESTKLSSLYATKESNDINVTISANASATSTKSQVSISVLKK